MGSGLSVALLLQSHSENESLLYLPCLNWEQFSSMLVYEVIVVLISILKWIACCDASVIVLCRCTITTFASVILTPIFCFTNACHGPTIFLVPSGKWIVCCIACAVAPCKCAITTFTSTAISAAGPIDWWKLLDFMCSLSIESASEVLPFSLMWLGTSLNDCFFCSQRLDPYQTSWWMWVALIFTCFTLSFAKRDLGGIPLTLLSARFSVYVYQGTQSLKLKDAQLQMWCPNGCRCFVLVFLCLVPMQPIRHSINLLLRFEPYFQLTNWSCWKCFWPLG